MEARRTAGLNNAPPCQWSSSPPMELREAPSHSVTANAGFVTFGNGRSQCLVFFFSFLTVLIVLKFPL